MRFARKLIYHPDPKYIRVPGESFDEFARVFRFRRAKKAREYVFQFRGGDICSLTKNIIWKSSVKMASGLVASLDVRGRLT